MNAMRAVVPAQRGPLTSPWPLPHELAQEWFEYWTDTCQRTALTWDVLRRRGNIYFEHRESGKPPVLVFDYEMVLDARDFTEQPVNYALVRILPPDDVATDPNKRPFVVSSAINCRGRARRTRRRTCTSRCPCTSETH